jgi:hypothetical protein
VWFEHPGHTYEGFISAFWERGMTWSESPCRLAAACWCAPTPSPSYAIGVGFGRVMYASGFTPWHQCSSCWIHTASPPAVTGWSRHLARGHRDVTMAERASSPGRYGPLGPGSWLVPSHNRGLPLFRLCHKSVGSWIRPTRLGIFSNISNSFANLKWFSLTQKIIGKWIEVRKLWNKFCWVDLDLF